MIGNLGRREEPIDYVNLVKPDIQAAAKLEKKRSILFSYIRSRKIHKIRIVLIYAEFLSFDEILTFGCSCGSEADAKFFFGHS